MGAGTGNARTCTFGRQGLLAYHNYMVGADLSNATYEDPDSALGWGLDVAEGAASGPS